MNEWLLVPSSQMSHQNLLNNAPDRCSYVLAFAIKEGELFLKVAHHILVFGSSLYPLSPIFKKHFSIPFLTQLIAKSSPFIDQKCT